MLLPAGGRREIEDALQDQQLDGIRPGRLG